MLKVMVMNTVRRRGAGTLRAGRLRRNLLLGLVAVALCLGGAYGVRAWGNYDQQMYADYSLVSCVDQANRIVKIAGFLVGDHDHLAVQRPASSVVSLSGMRGCGTTLRRSPPSLADTDEDHEALDRGESVIAYQRAIDQAAVAQRQANAQSLPDVYADALWSAGKVMIPCLALIAIAVGIIESLQRSSRW